ncbi:hypothetical protein NQ318_017911 [Aromia moschata]|uniref:Epoxide hydrolase N-terminal domain-containing protein n=1 Tax=Aromia moschata TaxID=1265417 RepID=A0AAV8YC22_9CUCU|nr:hypothetical protein NQ318_017911 [Aromia moschata]
MDAPHLYCKFLDELHWRLDNIAPFVLSLPATGNTYGINRDLLLRIYDTWRNAYNWREREKFLNQYPQFMIRVQGLLIHYLHVKPEQPEQPEDEYLEDWTLPVYPILLLHGWPGSIREFYEMIPELTSNKNKRVLLEVIAPSLPGFGFSEPPSRPGLDALNMAVLFKNFMNRLGFEEFYVHGGRLGRNYRPIDGHPLSELRNRDAL